MKGFLVCLEGLDRAGKDSTSKAVVKKLINAGYDVETISFPDYTTPLGQEIKKFLQGERIYNPEIRQLLYVANRFERKCDIENWLIKGKIIIVDRYSPSGLAYGLANNLDVDWMLNLEKTLPKADLVILIDVSADVAYLRGGEKDIYEKNLGFQEKVRVTYLNLAEKFNWIVINGEKPLDDVIATVEEIVLRHIDHTKG